MQIQIKNLLPLYFDPSRTQSSEIWGKDIVFTEGDLVKIVAPSGSGKTSLIHFLYGIRNEYSGTLLYDQSPLKELNPEQLAVKRSSNISIVFQDLRLLTEQTVEENLEIKRQLNPYHPKEKIREMAERLGIGDKLNSKAQTCSYGEQQRVAIIRALLQPFNFLLLDEPFSHLDDKNAERAMQLMLEEAGQRKAAIIFADLERVDFFPHSKIYHL